MVPIKGSNLGKIYQPQWAAAVAPTETRTNDTATSQISGGSTLR